MHYKQMTLASTPYGRHFATATLKILVQHELELELIQTRMTQKPILRVEVGARSLRVLIKKMRFSTTNTDTRLHIHK
jgi:hypothetical protein